MEFLSNAGPYLFTTVGAIIAAVLTNKRTKEAQETSHLVDTQTLVNETYEMVLSQIRQELTRKDKAHAEDREEWERKEVALNRKIRDLDLKVKELKAEVRDLRGKPDR